MYQNTESTNPKLGDQESHESYIEIKGAREHNLKNINLKIPKNKLVVITGVSGSGKSSLAFDTIFAEGQRRYVESLSAYARQFLGQLDKPDLDEIKGLSPAISIDQKSTTYNPRSTVGTVTEIYDHLRLLFARIGSPHCKVCGTKVESQSIDQIMDQIMSLATEDGNKALVLAPLVQSKKGEFNNLFSALKSEGFQRIRVDSTVYTLDEKIELEKNKKHTIELVIDRIAIKASSKSRIADSVSLALQRSEGVVIIHEIEKSKDHLFSELLACPLGHGSIPELDPKHFSFNSPHGACGTCSGIGIEMEFSENLIVPLQGLSLREGAIQPWTKTNNIYYEAILEALSEKLGFSLDTPYAKLDPEIKKIILEGYDDERIVINTKKYRSLGYSDYKVYYEGVITQLQRRYKESSSDSWKAEIEEYMLERPCPSCNGARLKPEYLAVKIANRNIFEISSLSIKSAYDFFDTLELFLNPYQKEIAKQVLIEIKTRLKFLIDVGLDYLTISRPAKTLSGGEFQRIRLASQIGSSLTGVLYVLDEPSIGLHQRDNGRLIQTLERLRDLGNTVLVVEHDDETIRASDYLVDIGPYAGVHGGRVVGCGNIEDIKQSPDSITGAFLSGLREIKHRPEPRKSSNKYLKLEGARKNNLKNLNLNIPLEQFVSITGVSGSGKSSLINELLKPALMNKLGYQAGFPSELDSISGHENLDKIIVIDQSPIGRTPRSNPATYIGVFDPIRKVFSETLESKARGYQPGRFSFNVKGGRCESCGGAGLVEIEMNFLPSVYIKCDVCKGKRYNKETLEVKYKGKSIFDILEMTVEDALVFFDAMPSIARKLQALYDVGLNYIKLGQAATTLSGGEAQRVKLASELSKRPTGKTIYLLDEPTTGLHWYDIDHLLNVLDRLVDSGNTVVVIEHNLDVIKHSDYIIDLGPEGGDGGGQIVGMGSPQELKSNPHSYTAKYL